jgi:queuosine precursor transporter
MEEQIRKKSEFTYLFLAGIFIAALVVCNLVANKFLVVDLGFKKFILSAGVLPYPITFLVTDILSEIYGKEKTNKVVFVGFFVSIFVLFVLWLGAQFPAIENSPVNDNIYNAVFHNAWRVVLASMTAYLVAQLIDIRLFHFWKKLTNGNHLWLRNNGSTIISQFADTFLVVCVLFVGVKPYGEIFQIILDGWFFKVLCALLDTPLFYLTTWYFRKKFNLKKGEELKS